MFRLLAPLALLLTPICLPAQVQETYSRVLIHLGQHPEKLTELGIETDHGIRTPTFLCTDLSQKEIQRVKSAGFQTELLLPDVLEWYEAQKSMGEPRGASCPDFSAAYQTPSNYSFGSMGGYHTLPEMLSVLDSMHLKFPTLISERKPLSNNLLTHEGRPLWYVQISDNPGLEEGEPEVLFTALHHAREPNSLSQLLFFMWYLLENYHASPEIRAMVDHANLCFVPCLNPDGYEFNRTILPNGGGMWRKNRRDNNDGTYGVDLNRNYGFYWGNDNQGSSPNTDAPTYRGPAPFSEPETRMLRNFAQEHHFLLAQHYHTFGNWLIYPFSYSNIPADTAFVTLADWFTEENNYLFGNSTQTVGYPVNGDSNDWFYGSEGTLAFTPEVGTTGFWPQQNEIDGLNKAALTQNLKTVWAALKYGETTDLGPKFISEQAAQSAVKIRRMGLQDGNFIVSMLPLDTWSLVTTPPQTVNPARFESVFITFNYEVAPGIQPGQQFRFLLKTDNGLYVQTDTLERYFGGVTYTLASNNGSTGTGWQGDWAVTTEHFFSPPSCITDSPEGPYANGESSSWTMAAPVYLPENAIDARLEFMTKWNYAPEDGCQVTATATDGTTQPLCGLLTSTGRNWHPRPNEPLFINTSEKWQRECMDLRDFIGKTFQITFTQYDNGGNVADGIYVDDVQVTYTNPLILSTANPNTPTLLLHPSDPNPTRFFTTIRWESLHESGSLLVRNAKGRVVHRLPVEIGQNQIGLQTATWPAGVYFYSLQTPSGVSETRRMVVIH